MTVTELFATRLKSLREDSGLSQTQLADALGVSRGSISFYENGERTPDIAFLAVVKDYFGVSLDYLLGYSESKYSAKPVVDINAFTGLPPYAQNRIEAIKDRMAQVASKYIPAKGNDPHFLFDCIYSDILTVLGAYEHLHEDIGKGWDEQETGLQNFKSAICQTSEIKIIRYLYEHDFKVRENVVVTYQKNDAKLEVNKGRRKK